jgi:hypothetical protein
MEGFSKWLVVETENQTAACIYKVWATTANIFTINSQLSKLIDFLWNTEPAPGILKLVCMKHVSQKLVNPHIVKSCAWDMLHFPTATDKHFVSHWR